MARERIYADHAASTPILEVVVERMVQVLGELGNPSSPHLEGRVIRDRLEEARDRAAAALGCRAREILFTSGGTEGCQLAFLGVAGARAFVAERVVLTGAEHPAIADAADTLASMGWHVVRIRPGRDGLIDLEAFVSACQEPTAAAAMIHVNHEMGAVLPVAEAARALRPLGVPLVSDACLTVGRLPFRTEDLGADAVILSAHKFNGPRGMGLIFLRRRTRMAPLWTGGLQEERLRPGTENVAGAHGLVTALEYALREQGERGERLAGHDRTFLEQLEGVDGWAAVGPTRDRAPGIVAIELPGVEGEAAMINLDLDGIAVSTGSSCALGATEPSPTLLAMGLSRARAASTLRFSFSHLHSTEDIARVGRSVGEVARRLRALARGGPA